MKHIFRVISSFLLIATIAISISVTSFAADDSAFMGLSGPTDVFIDVCNHFFKGDGEYRAIDNEGNDITASFFSKYIHAYNEGDYDLIWVAVKNELSSITWDPNALISPYLTINSSASKSYYKLETTSKGYSFELLYTVSGTFQYHDSTGTITWYSNGKVNIDSFNAGALFSYTMHDVSTSAKLASGSKSVTFSGTFYLTFHYNSLNIPGLTWTTEEFGPYTGTATGYSPY